MNPFWNDLWFPLILAPGRGDQDRHVRRADLHRQFVTNWNALAALSLAILPALVLT